MIPLFINFYINYIFGPPNERLKLRYWLYGLEYVVGTTGEQ